jgi:hypothetical protein
VANDIKPTRLVRTWVGSGADNAKAKPSHGGHV